MGRLLILILIVVVIVLVWRAFGPGTWGKGVGRSGMAGPGSLGGDRRGGIGWGPRSEAGQPRIKGPDDDEDFLWRLEKQRFDEQRARDRAEEAEREQRRLAEERRRRASGNAGRGSDTGSDDGSGANGPRADGNDTTDDGTTSDEADS
ncbi:hypothetical protein [Corynebacterium freneyi]|uniref:hypothetical protein n=1 Tax=Corynebacterium freneyi TaxID=134034 RepID=UPI001CCF043C|nr:hypothetical protein [Corynebacterium freneyi]UBI02633.1 hypothetical protein LA334_01965 [Corynebacterium freneyi]WJZ04265.1 hypothetical protein CFREN_01370 [Corynebacterium freneyi]